jgi:hypothetical protein
VPVNPNVKLCTHIKITGHRCGSPALRGEQFCYFHQRMMRGVKTPPEARLHPIALIENEEAIQASLMEVINALARNTIDVRRADLILKALHIAVKNGRHAKFGMWAERMVQQVPDYPAPPKSATYAQPEFAAEAAPATRPAAPATAIDPAQRKPPASVRELIGEHRATTAAGEKG